MKEFDPIILYVAAVSNPPRSALNLLLINPLHGGECQVRVSEFGLGLGLRLWLELGLWLGLGLGLELGLPRLRATAPARDVTGARLRLGLDLQFAVCVSR